MNELTPLLEQLLAQAGVAVGRAWPALVEYQYTQALGSALAGGAVAIAGLVVTAEISRRTHKSESLEDTVIVCVVGLLLTVILAVVASFVGSVLGSLLSPEGAAVHSILRGRR